MQKLKPGQNQATTPREEDLEESPAFEVQHLAELQDPETIPQQAFDSLMGGKKQICWCGHPSCTIGPMQST